MSRYIVQRVALVPMVAFLVASLVFVLARALPGDIVTVLAAEAPQYGDATELRSELGLDKPVEAQYFDFLKGAIQGDFGNSLFFREPVSNQLKQALPVTIELTVLAVLASVLIAVPLGVASATHRSGPIDHAIRGLGTIFHTLPSFWIGTLVLTFLAIWFSWTPPARYTPIWVNPVTNLQQFIIPTIVLAMGTMGLKMRLVRSQMLEVLSQDYIRTAQAKGLPNGLVIRRHALQNAMVPVVSIIGNQTGALLGGAAIIESIFNLPGLGRVLILAVDNRDYPTIQATVLVTAMLLVFVNLMTDLLYAWLNPRIRYS
jgi:peptide/nickel transport system permease protein